MDVLAISVYVLLVSDVFRASEAAEHVEYHGNTNNPKPRSGNGWE